ncbi:MAG TPA: MOSC N-terminal beta barrel domain-containing protein, partial [Nitrospiraceae bacterium]|nr:MOSC N-terminal beta barrel domain-containing protein [Nitrospiraceae bacterium]
MKVAQIWRYPIKSMSGEQVNHARIGSLGIEGDRIVHVKDVRGHIITARTHHRLLGHRATLNASGEPLVDGVLWNDPTVREELANIVGLGVRLVRDESTKRFDVLPLLVATDGAIAAFGYDGRRLRPNLVIGGVEGLSERGWPGQCLRIGDVIIGIQDLRGRCIMTTFDPDSLKQDRQVLMDIARKFGGTLALNCYVIRGGEIRGGDSVELLPKDECETICA